MAVDEATIYIARHRWRWPAAGCPCRTASLVQATWVTTVSPTSANLRATINPGEPSPYLFEYTTEADYLQNGFDNATKVPAGPEATINGVNFAVAVVQHPSASKRTPPFASSLVATNSDGTVEGPVRSFRTDQAGDRPSRCPTTAAGRWSPRSTKTAARSRASAATSAAACSRPPPRGTRSPTPRPPPSATPRARRGPASTSRRGRHRPGAPRTSPCR